MIRKEFPDSSLADLYDPIAMPPKLVKAHKELDKAVDACYSKQVFTTELSRLGFFACLIERSERRFILYIKYTASMFGGKKEAWEEVKLLVRSKLILYVFKDVEY